MRCGYCGSSVVIPESLRSIAATAPPVVPPLGMDLSQLVAQGLRMGEVVRLTRRGERTEAIQLYRENTGATLEQATAAIDAIAKGKAPGVNLAAAPVMAEVLAEAEAERASRRQIRRARSSNGCCGTIVVGVILAVVLIYLLNSAHALGPLSAALNAWLPGVKP